MSLYIKGVVLFTELVQIPLHTVVREPFGHDDNYLSTTSPHYENNLIKN